jgi:hypothetical protein
MRRAVATLWPLWAIAVALTVVHVLVGENRSQPAEITLLDYALLVLSTVVLPFIAGYLYLRRCNGRLLGAALAGVSIPLGDVLGVGIAYTILQAEWLGFVGFVIATFMFSVVPSTLFGIAGLWVARRYEPRHT